MRNIVIKQRQTRMVQLPATAAIEYVATLGVRGRGHTKRRRADGPNDGSVRRHTGTDPSAL